MTPSSNIQSMIASINNNVHHHASATTAASTNTTPTIPSSLLISRTSIPSNGATNSPISAIISANNLNDLKSKFEPPVLPSPVTQQAVVAPPPPQPSVQLRASTTSKQHSIDTPTLLSASTTTLVSSNNRSSHVITPRESKNYSATLRNQNDLNNNPSSETIATTPLVDNVMVKLRKSVAADPIRSPNRLSNRLSSPETNLAVLTSPKTHRSRDSMPDKQQTRSSIQLVVSSDCNDWVNLKTHSAKCNIMLRKKRRGNKRSKSLPSKFE